MNEVLTNTDIVNKISHKLSGERFVRGGKKKSWLSKYHLRYTKDIIKMVMDAYNDVMTEAIADGDSVKMYNYFKIEPKHYKERFVQINGFYGTGKNYVPSQYKVKLTMGKKMKEACNVLLGKTSAIAEKGNG